MAHTLWKKTNIDKTENNNSCLTLTCGSNGSREIKKVKLKTEKEMKQIIRNSAGTEKVLSN